MWSRPTEARLRQRPALPSLLLAAGVLACTPSANANSASTPAATKTTATAPTVTVHPNGLGSFRLGAALEKAARQMARLDAAALQIGPGCDGRDESVVGLSVAGWPMTVMAMADPQGRIAEVVASAPHQGPAVTEPACRAQAQRWAQQLDRHLARAGGWGSGSVNRLAAQTQPTVPHGAALLSAIRWPSGARLESRWFAGGNTCDLSLHFVPRAVPRAGVW